MVKIKLVWAGVGRLLLSLVDLGWVVLFLLWVGDGMLPGEGVGDLKDYNKSSSRQPRKLIFSMQPYLNPSRQNMEDDLHFL